MPVFIIQFILPIIFYSLAYRRNWFNISQYSSIKKSSHLWGILFSSLFFLLTPIFMWRYGVKNTIFLISFCILVPSIPAYIFDNLDDYSKVMLALTLSIPIKALTGCWLAKNDLRLREAIIDSRLKRKIDRKRKTR